MIHGVIFDFDGTLFDSMDVWDTVGADYLRSIGKEPEEGLTDILETMSLRQGAAYCKEAYELSTSVQEIMDGVNRIVENFYFYTVMPRPGVQECLQKLRENGVRMCIATATERYQVAAALERCHLESYFSEILTCTDVGAGKDEPAIFREAMQHLQTDRTHTLVVEDAYHALCTAKSDGFLTAAVYDAHEKRQEELKKLADIYMHDFIDMDFFWKFALGI